MKSAAPLKVWLCIAWLLCASLSLGEQGWFFSDPSALSWKIEGSSLVTYFDETELEEVHFSFSTHYTIWALPDELLLLARHEGLTELVWVRDDDSMDYWLDDRGGEVTLFFGDNRPDSWGRAIDLSPIDFAWRKRDLAVVPVTGSQDQTVSLFDSSLNEPTHAFRHLLHSRDGAVWKIETLYDSGGKLAGYQPHSSLISANNHDGWPYRSYEIVGYTSFRTRPGVRRHLVQGAIESEQRLNPGTRLEDLIPTLSHGMIHIPRGQSVRSNRARSPGSRPDLSARLTSFKLDTYRSPERTRIEEKWDREDAAAGLSQSGATYRKWAFLCAAILGPIGLLLMIGGRARKRGRR